jgi:hypothetical protein
MDDRSAMAARLAGIAAQLEDIAGQDRQLLMEFGRLRGELRRVLAVLPPADVDARHQALDELRAVRGALLSQFELISGALHGSLPDYALGTWIEAWGDDAAYALALMRALAAQRRS